MSATHGSVCVCERSVGKEDTPVTARNQNRTTAACVSDHTHAFAVGSDRSPTLPRIHTNYKQTNGSEIKGVCIQTDYVGCGRDV